MFLFMNECVIVYTGVILCCSCSSGAGYMCFPHKQVCICLFRCHSMLFVLVKRRCTYGFIHERVCNCLYISHSMLFVLVRSRVTCVFLINECVIVYTGVILCCSCSLGAVSHVLLLMNECVIVYTGVILCCSCSLGGVLHVFSSKTSV